MQRLKGDLRDTSTEATDLQDGLSQLNGLWVNNAITVELAQDTGHDFHVLCKHTHIYKHTLNTVEQGSVSMVLFGHQKERSDNT